MCTEGKIQQADKQGATTEGGSSLRRLRPLSFLEMFILVSGSSFGEASPLLAGWSLYTGQCLLVASTCCHWLEKIKNIGPFYFLPVARQRWLAGELLNWHWQLSSSLQDGNFGYLPEFDWGFRSQVPTTASGSGALFPLFSRNCSSLLTVI